jgi:catechol 2,3-dioxygenase-like lactoylglutathione lyase family enzyme
MIDHTGIGVADVARSAAFYDAALGALGLRRVMELPEGVGSDGVGYGVDYPVFWIDRFHPHSVRQHTAFAARSRAEVDAFHAAAVKAGGTDNGPPGLRDMQGYPPGYYAAFVLDPDGNNMEAVFRSFHVGQARSKSSASTGSEAVSTSRDSSDTATPSPAFSSTPLSVPLPRAS